MSLLPWLPMLMPTADTSATDAAGIDSLSLLLLTQVIPVAQVLLLLDVDFMISSSLNALQHESWLQNAVSQGMLVVLPALEPIKSDAAAQQAVIKTCTGESTCCQGLRSA